MEPREEGGRGADGAFNSGHGTTTPGTSIDKSGQFIFQRQPGAPLREKKVAGAQVAGKKERKKEEEAHSTSSRITFSSSSSEKLLAFFRLVG